MKREAVNFSRIPARHDAINKRLEDWAKWVRYHPQAWKTPAIWSNYRSHAWQWEMPEVRIQLNTIECHETERAVCFLPTKNRTAIRWAYVWPYIPDNAVRRELAVTRIGLEDLVNAGRDMLKNRLREKMLDKS